MATRSQHLDPQLHRLENTGSFALSAMLMSGVLLPRERVKAKEILEVRGDTPPIFGEIGGDAYGDRR